MAHSLTVTFGSGILPHIADYHPVTSGIWQVGTYPQPKERYGEARRLGNVTPVAILNMEDCSAHFGMRTTQITVGSSALPLPGSSLENRRAIAIQNLGPGTLYIGDDANVAIGDGYPLAPNTNKEIAFDIKGNVRVYGISDGTSDVRILEVS